MIKSSLDFISLCPSVVAMFDPKRGRKTIILDRDGTINLDNGYIHDPAEFEFTEKFKIISKSLSRFNGNICIVTNQGGVGLGKFSQSQSEVFTKYVISEMNKLGIEVSFAVACYHHDIDKCAYRKPNPGMVQYVLDELEIPCSSCIFLGNDLSDRELAGCMKIKYVDISDIDLEIQFLEWMAAK